MPRLLLKYVAPQEFQVADMTIAPDAAKFEIRPGQWYNPHKRHFREGDPLENLRAVNLMFVRTQTVDELRKRVHKLMRKAMHVGRTVVALRPADMTTTFTLWSRGESGILGSGLPTLVLGNMDSVRQTRSGRFAVHVSGEKRLSYIPIGKDIDVFVVAEVLLGADSNFEEGMKRQRNDDIERLVLAGAHLSRRQLEALNKRPRLRGLPKAGTNYVVIAGELDFFGLSTLRRLFEEELGKGPYDEVVILGLCDKDDRLTLIELIDDVWKIDDALKFRVLSLKIEDSLEVEGVIKGAMALVIPKAAEGYGLLAVMAQDHEIPIVVLHGPVTKMMHDAVQSSTAVDTVDSLALALKGRVNV